jgi:methanogenic corrinoid protein MtbC1
MTGLQHVAAEILETSAAGYASAASALLQREGPLPEDPSAGTWKGHLAQRVLELAAAVRVNEPALFARRITWLRRAMAARGANEATLRSTLLALRAALDREVPAHLKPAIQPALDLAMRALDERLAPEEIALDPAKPADRLALRYLQACLEGDPQRAIGVVMSAIDAGLAPAAAYSQVLIAAQKEIGQLWHAGDVSIAEERVVTETTRELMTLIAAKYSPKTGNGRTLVAASVAGNAHDIGVRVVADLFQLAGWRCLFLGANVPAAEIARAAEAFDADLVVVTATLATQLKPLGEAIAALRLAAPGLKILVGGLAFEGAPDLWKQLGADAYAETVDSAVAAGNTLVGIAP